MNHKVVLVLMLFGTCLLGSSVLHSVTLRAQERPDWVTVSQREGIVSSPVVPIEQSAVLAAAKQYTEFWIAGQYDQLYSLISPHSIAYDAGRQARFTHRLQRLHAFWANGISDSVTPEAMHLVPISQQQLQAFFVSALDSQSLGLFRRNLWPDLSQANIVMVEFLLQQKRYRQVWEREPSGQWLCLNLPLDLDDATLNLIILND